MQSHAIISFYDHLSPPQNIPEDVTVLNPFLDQKVRTLVTRFYNKYYHDQNPRTYLIGINPGRLGAGITGLPFTDPIRLEGALGLQNEWPKKSELSSRFVFDLIDSFGGAEAFFNRFYITSVSPLGFLSQGKNLNYYDRLDLQLAVEPYAIKTLTDQLQSIRSNREVAFCLGQGKNYAYFNKLNEKHGFFKRVEPLPHPRWVMQYRLKRKMEFLDAYLLKLKSAIEPF